MRFWAIIVLSFALLSSGRELDAQELKSLPLHLRKPGQKALVIANGGEADGIIEVLGQYKIPYELTESFDKDRRDYDGIFAIIAASLRVDYFGKPETRVDAAFEHIDRFVRTGGHLFCFGAFNGRNFHQLRRYGFVTSGRHGYKVARDDPYTDILFHGLEDLVPESLDLHMVGGLGVEGPSIVMLKRGETSLPGTPVLATVKADAGRVSVLMVEPFYRNSMWILPIATHWVARGAPTTVEQLKRNPVVDPFTFREHQFGQREQLPADKLQTLQAEIPGNLAADQLMQRAREVNGEEEQFAALLLAAEKYAQTPNADAAIGALLAAAKLFQVDLLKEQARLLKQCEERVLDQEEANEIARLALNAYEDAVDVHRIEHAWDLANVAQSASEFGGNEHYEKLSAMAVERVEPLKNSWMRVSNVFEELKANPENPALNAEVGQFMAFVAEDWDIGLACLANGDNDLLRELAELSLSPPDSTLERLRLADRWLRFAQMLKGQERRNVEKKVRGWYAELHDNLGDLNEHDRQRVEAFLERASKQSVTLEVRMTLDGYGFLTLRQQDMQWETKSGIEPALIEIDDQRWNPVTTERLRNRGATRFVPENINFDVVDVEKKSGRGIVRIESRGEDYLIVRINDVPSGRDQYRLTISFGD